MPVTLLDVTADHVLILRNAGPKGGPGMPEWGMLPIPKKLLQKGVRDMVRISDARMSGTAFGTIVLHITPESAVGGPLALVKNGDMIRLDSEKGTLEVNLTQEEFNRRAISWKPRNNGYGSGALFKYAQQVGADSLASAAITAAITLTFLGLWVESAIIGCVAFAIVCVCLWISLARSSSDQDDGEDGGSGNGDLLLHGVISSSAPGGGVFGFASVATVHKMPGAH